MQAFVCCATRYLVRAAACPTNIGEYLEIHGVINPRLFEIAVRRVVTEAKVLHVTFVDDSEGPRQILDTPVDWSFPVIDVSAEAEPLAAAEDQMQTDLAQRWI